MHRRIGRRSSSGFATTPRHPIRTSGPPRITWHTSPIGAGMPPSSWTRSTRATRPPTRTMSMASTPRSGPPTSPGRLSRSKRTPAPPMRSWPGRSRTAQTRRLQKAQGRDGLSGRSFHPTATPLGEHLAFWHQAQRQPAAGPPSCGSRHAPHQARRPSRALGDANRLLFAKLGRSADAAAHLARSFELHPDLKRGRNRQGPRPHPGGPRASSGARVRH